MTLWNVLMKWNQKLVNHMKLFYVTERTQIRSLSSTIPEFTTPMFPRYAEIKMWKYHKAKLLQEFCQRNSKTKLQYYRVAPLAGLTEKAGRDTPFIVLAGMGKAPFSYNFNIFLSSGTLKHVSSNWIIHKHTIINIDIFICIWFQKIIIVSNLVWTRIKMI